MIRLNLPDVRPFDASALLRTPGGEFLTVNNRQAGIYRVELLSDGLTANLIRLTDRFPHAEMARLGFDREPAPDWEGLAQDETGRLYVCDEARRWILRWSPGSNRLERLPIDWSPVATFFSPVETNASFEGIAVGRGRLFVANERSSPVIAVVDLESFRVVDQFVVYPAFPSLLGTHYSDLAWHEGHLWVLLRHDRVVLEVEPETKRVVAEYEFGALEDRLRYRKRLPTGIMEGLWVERESLWLLTDNNGYGREDAPNDRRPTLLKCRRPGR